MQYDIWKYTLIIIAGGILGFAITSTALGVSLGMLLAALAVIAWQIHRLNMIQKWMDKPQEAMIPEMNGMFYQLHKNLNRKEAKYRKRKVKLIDLIAQFRSAISTLPDAIVLIDSNGKIEWANENADDLLRIRWPEDSGVRFTDLFRYPEVQQLLSSKSPDDTGIEVSSHSFDTQTINIKCVPYSHDTRMVLARDVSRLVKVNQMHSDFVANVSHELKTPLTVLKGYVEILLGAKVMPEQFKKPLDQMNVQCSRMQFIVNDLLYLAKLEDNENIQPRKKVEISHLVNSIIEAVQPLLEEKQHRVNINITPDIAILGAETELHSAFSNLITNAINYTPAGGVITITWESGASETQEGEEPAAVFSVQDDGDGIPPHHLSRLTQRFYRVDTDRSREGGGTGLGLAIVKHVMQRHNAELDIKSTEGFGSTFRCLFPAHQVIEQSTMPNTRGIA